MSPPGVVSHCPNAWAEEDVFQGKMALGQYQGPLIHSLWCLKGGGHDQAHRETENHLKRVAKMP